MKKKRHILSTLLLTACMVVGIGTYASAAYYSKMLAPPFDGCAQRTDESLESTTSPYVSPSTNTLNTTYCLVLPNYPPTIVVSSYVKTASPGRNSFSYLSGYGGYKQKYRMLMYPSVYNFSAYVVTGTWSP